MNTQKSKNHGKTKSLKYYLSYIRPLALRAKSESSYEGKHQYLIKICENSGLKNLKDSKTFIEYSNNMLDV